MVTGQAKTIKCHPRNLITGQTNQIERCQNERGAFMDTLERGLHIQDVLNGSGHNDVAPQKRALSKGHQAKKQLQYCSGTSRLSSSP